MSETEKTADYGFGVGQDAGALRQFGATDQQIRNYVNFKGYMVPGQYKNAYMVAARKGFQKYETMTTNPIFKAHMANLKMYIEINAACIR